MQQTDQKFSSLQMLLIARGQRALFIIFMACQDEVWDRCDAHGGVYIYCHKGGSACKLCTYSKNKLSRRKATV